MDWITVAGLRPYDGRYELDLDEAPFTTREWGWIKRYAGYLPVTLTPDTFTDPELITVLAIVAIHRGGSIQTGDVPEVWDKFVDAPFGSAITFEPGPAEEDDADGPPAESSTVRSPISGENSNGNSGSSEPDPSPTGTPASDTSESAPAMSGS